MTRARALVAGISSAGSWPSPPHSRRVGLRSRSRARGRARLLREEDPEHHRDGNGCLCRRHPEEHEVLPPPRRLRHRDDNPHLSVDVRHRRRRRLRARRRLGRRRSAATPTRARSIDYPSTDGMPLTLDTSRDVTGTIDLTERRRSAPARSTSTSRSRRSSTARASRSAPTRRRARRPDGGRLPGRVHDPAGRVARAGADLQGLDLRVHVHGPYADSGFIGISGKSCIDVAVVRGERRTSRSSSRSTTRRSRTRPGPRSTLGLDVERRDPDAGGRQAHDLRPGRRRASTPRRVGVHDLHRQKESERDDEEATASRLAAVGRSLVRSPALGRRRRARTARTTPLYMPDASNIGNPALQPPPVCCVPGPPVAAGEPAPVNMALLRRPRAGDAEDLPRLLGLGPAGRVRPHDARDARPTTPTARRSA